MTIISGSRNADSPFAIVTLADLLSFIRADTTLSVRRRDDIASALRIAAKMLAKSMEEVPVQAEALRAVLKGFAPAMVQLAQGRRNNVRSLLRAALKQAGIGTKAPIKTALAPAWTAVFALIGTKNKKLRVGLSRLAHFATGRGIAPAEVTDVVMVDLLVHLECDGLHKTPRKAYRNTCMNWNRAATTIAGWPAHQLTLPSYSRAYVLSRELLPASLVADIDAFLFHLRGDDLAEESDFKPLRPRSIATRRQQIFGFVSALILSGHPAERCASLAEIIHPELVKAGLRFIRTQAVAKTDGKVLTAGRKHAHYTARALVCVVKYWIKPDPDDAQAVKLHEAKLAALKAIAKVLKDKKTGLTAGNRTLLRHFDDPEMVDRFYMLPSRLIAPLRGVNAITREHALTYQLALLVEVLQMIPIRLKNLSELEIGKNLIRGRDGRWHIALSEEETKNESVLEAMFPESTGKMIDTYRQTYRPLLMGGTRSSWLFPGRLPGSHKSCDMLREQICEGTHRNLGVRINPHAFRHTAAKVYLEANPGAYGVVQRLLGHKSIATTIDSYCGTEAAQAFKTFDTQIVKRRAEIKAAEDTKRRSRKPPRKTKAGE